MWQLRNSNHHSCTVFKCFLSILSLPLPPLPSPSFPPPLPPSHSLPHSLPLIPCQPWLEESSTPSWSKGDTRSARLLSKWRSHTTLQVSVCLCTKYNCSFEMLLLTSPCNITFIWFHFLLLNTSSLEWDLNVDQIVMGIRPKMNIDCYVMWMRPNYRPNCKCNRNPILSPMCWENIELVNSWETNLIWDKGIDARQLCCIMWLAE